MATLACVRCSERKVRCDRKAPCNSCVRHNVQCVFRPPKPSRRKRAVAQDEVVLEKLKRYEALLREKGVDPEQAPGSSASESQGEVARQKETVFQPQLLQGRKGTKLVDK